VRLVTVEEGPDGRSRLGACEPVDLAAPPGVAAQDRGGYGLWGLDAVTKQIPVAYTDLRTDPRVPPPSGVRVHAVRFPPAPDRQVDARRHRTDSIDIAFVLTGVIILTLDDGDVALRAGDCVIQPGTWHSWHNPHTEPCVVGFVMLGAQRTAKD
jgi:quercetin dioxygenase-like cupin family protein